MRSYKEMDINAIKERLREFADARDWDKFHSPKNLAMALSAEAGELLEVFQWLTEEESRNPDKKVLARANEELADVIIYAIRLADKLNVDISRAVEEKIESNGEKYPVEKSKGNAQKYSDLK